MVKLSAETNGAAPKHPPNGELPHRFSWFSGVLESIVHKAMPKFPEFGPLAEAHIQFNPTLNIRGIEIHLHYDSQAGVAHPSPREHVPQIKLGEEKAKHANPKYAPWFINFIDWIRSQNRRNGKVLNLDDYRGVENPKAKVVIPGVSSIGVMDLARVTQSKS